MPQPNAKNWIAVTPSRFPHEQEALDFIHERFPASPDYLAWSNFEFIASDGSVNEVDLLVASPWGVFLIEIKSRPGKLSGDNYNWTWSGEDGRRFTDDNPVLLANRKCKRLKDLLGRQPPFRNREVPFIQPLVFCSATDLVLQLPPDARNFVCVRDNAEKARPGIRAAIFQRQCPGLRVATERLVDSPTLKSFGKAMAEAGLRRQRRKVADFILDQLRYESPAGVFQDWEAHHSTSESVRRLIRIYLTVTRSSKEERDAVSDAAKREFNTLARLSHPGILRAQIPADSELGPAIVFEFDPTAQRLDHFLAENRTKLDVAARLQLLQQITDAIRYAHDKDVVHRALSPQAIFVLRDKATHSRIQIYNWHTGARLPDGSFSGLTNLTASLHAAHLVEEPARAFLAPESLTPNEEPAEAMDVFSLGALAYFLFGDQPPAADATELLEKLKASSSRSLELRETVYRRLTERIATAANSSGAFRSIIDTWFYALEEDLLSSGKVKADDAAGLVAATNALMEQRLDAISRNAPAFAAALRGYRVAQERGDTATAEGLIAWVAGQPNVSATIKRAADLKGDVDHFAALSFLQGLLVVLRDSGHAGLLVVLDEVETLQRVRADVREKSLNALRQLIDEIDAGRFPGLFLVITGTPAFFDGPQGMQKLPPLAQRLHTDFETDPKFDNPRAPQIRLRAFDRSALIDVGRRVREIFVAGAKDPAGISARATDDLVESLADAVAGELGGKVGIAPRLFLKKWVADLLDRIELHPDFDPRKDYRLTLRREEMTAQERNLTAASSVEDISLDV